MKTHELAKKLLEYKDFELEFIISDGYSKYGVTIRKFSGFHLVDCRLLNYFADYHVVEMHEIDEYGSPATTCMQFAEELLKHDDKELQVIFSDMVGEPGDCSILQRRFDHIECCDIGYSSKVYLLTGTEISTGVSVETAKA